MKRHRLLFLLFLLGLTPSCSPQKQEATPVNPIGIYDTRALAIAFVGSAPHKKKLSDLMAAHEQAKAAGDSATVAKLEDQGQVMQQKTHQQAFGTANVDDILAHIPEAIITIKKEAGVTNLISKWNKAELKKHKGAETIDLTLPLVEALKPTAQQRQRAIEILKKKPVEIED